MISAQPVVNVVAGEPPVRISTVPNAGTTILLILLTVPAVGLLIEMPVAGLSRWNTTAALTGLADELMRRRSVCQVSFAPPSAMCGKNWLAEVDPVALLVQVPALPLTD